MMTAWRQAPTPYDAVAAIDDAARYTAGHLAFHRLLETTDPDGWDLARRLAICLQNEAHHFPDEFVRPGRQTQRPFLPVAFRDPDPLAGPNR